MLAVASVLPDGPVESSINTPSATVDLALSISQGGAPTLLGFQMWRTNGTLDPASPVIKYDDAGETPLEADRIVLDDPDTGGGTDSLLLVELSPGDYIVRVGEENGSIGTFQVDVFLPGDLGNDGVVDDSEYVYATAAVLHDSGQWNAFTERFFLNNHGINLNDDLYRQELDANLDGVIDEFDLAQVEKNVNAPVVQLELVGDQDGPVIAPWLVNDNGRDPGDRIATISTDPAIVGTITDASEINAASFEGRLVALVPGHPVLGEIQSLEDSLTAAGNGFTFELDVATLEGLYKGSLPDGEYRLELAATDEHENLGTTSFTFTKLSYNDAPQAGVLSNQEIPEDTPLDVDIAGLFSDADLAGGDNLLLAASFDSALIAGVTFTDNPQTYDTTDLGVTIVPVANQHGGPTEITLSATDAMGAEATATLTVTVNSANDPPSFIKGADPTVDEDAGPQTVANWATGINEGAPNESGQTLTFNITGNSNTALFAAGPAIAPDGTLTYTPADDAYGAAEIKVTLSDDGGTANNGQDTSAEQTFTITVNSANDAPSFTKGTDQTVNEDAGSRTVADWAADINKGASNESGQTLTFNITGNSNTALFAAGPAIDADGTLTYTPADDAYGSAQIKVTLRDDGGTANNGQDTSAEQTFTITVDLVNDAPSFASGADQAVDEDAGSQTVANWATGIDEGAPNESGQTLAFNITANSNTALFAAGPAIAADGTLTYTPADDAHGSAQVKVTLSDDGGTANNGQDTSVEQTFTITVNSVNDAPAFASGADQAVDEDAGAQTVANWATGIDEGAPNESGQTLAFNITANSNTALFAAGPVIAADGTLTYTPADDASGSAQVKVTLSDDGGTANNGQDTSAEQTFTITIDSVNDPPTAGNDLGPNDDGIPLTIGAVNPIDVLANDSILPDSGETLTIQSTTDPAVGSVAIVNQGASLAYTVPDDAELDGTTATFDYTITDGQLPDTAQVKVLFVLNSVTATDDEFPQAGGDPIMEEGGAVPLDVLANDEDLQGDNFSIISADAVGDQGGQITIVGNGASLNYEPAANFSGTETFRYTIQDDHVPSASAVGTVTVTVTGVNDSPTANDDTGTTNEDQAVAIDVLANDTDPDTGDTKSVQSVVTTGTLGAVTNNGANVTYDPDGAFEQLPVGEQATDTFTYTMVDGQGESSTATVTVTVTGANDAPTANTDTGSTDEDHSVAIDVLANDTDPDTSDTKSVQSVDTTGTLGAVTNNGTNVTYNPNGAFENLSVGQSATDTFTYTMVDGQGQSSAATVTVTVTGANDAPTANTDTGSTNANNSVAIDVLANDTDPDSGDTKSVQSVDNTGTLGAVTNNGTDVTYDPNGAFEHLAGGEQATDTFTYTMVDGQGQSSAATVTVTVTGVNDAPELVGQGVPDVVVQKDGDPNPAPLNLPDYFTDPDGDVLTFDIDDPGNDVNTDLLDVDLTGDTLTITYESYAALQERSISTIVVTATDPGSESVTSTFTVTVNPVKTVEVELVVLETATPEAQAEGMMSLPASLSDVAVQQDYVVEIWMKDLLIDDVTSGPITQGLVGAAFDLNFNANLAEGVDPLHHDGVFETLPVGAINNSSGVVEGFGGGTLSVDYGVEPYYVRLGYAQFTATDTGGATYSVDLDDSGRLNNPISLPSRQATGGDAIGAIHESQISLGSVSVTHVAGSALYGTGANGSESNAAGVYMSLVKNPTAVDADGHVAELPENETWIDEWDSYWVELWVHTTEASGVAAASVDFAYNTEYFTATEIEHGPVYVNDTSGSIDDPTGLVSGVGGISARSGIGGDGSGYALLGRVKFESLDEDQVSVDAGNQFIGPYDLGLELTDARVEVAGAGAVEAELGRSPATDLWAVVYDIDDDDRIGFGDFAYFANAFQENATASDTPFALALDFDHSGSVDFGDFAYFAANFQQQKGSAEDLQFPISFTQRWIGSASNVDGTVSVGDLLDAATGTWQRALGAAEPIDIQLVFGNFGDNQLGEGRILALDDQGQPTAGRVTVDDDALGLGWYSNLNEPVDADKYDLYTVLLHEIGHTLGFTQAYAGFAHHVQTEADGSTIFVGSDFTAELDGSGQHLDPLANRNDLMNPTLAPGVRKLPSLVDVQILHASYEAARAGATGFSTDAMALHDGIEPASPEPEPLARENASTRGIWALGNRTEAVYQRPGMLPVFAKGLRSEGWDAPVTPACLLARPAVELSEHEDASNAFPWFGWDGDRELDHLLNELEVGFTSELTTLETIDAAFARW